MQDLLSLEREALGCVACPLHEERTKVVFGVGDPHAAIMFIGEGPGRDEDLQGEPFVGRSGRLLDRLIGEELGITRAQCYIANVVKCRPPGNRDPLPVEVATCAHFLSGQLAAIAPPGRGDPWELRDPLGTQRHRRRDEIGAPRPTNSTAALSFQHFTPPRLYAAEAWCSHRCAPTSCVPSPFSNKHRARERRSRHQ